MFMTSYKSISFRITLMLALLAGALGVIPAQAAPSITLGWAKGMGSSEWDTGVDAGYNLALDDNGNIYTVGIFNGTVDFDPGAGITNLTSQGNYDVFITKFDN